jgi:tetratricopeptide (TPR) repeat protein
MSARATKQDAAPEAAAESKGGTASLPRRALGWLTGSRLRIAALAAAVVLALAAGIGGVVVSHRRAAQDQPVTLEQALAALDHHDDAAARVMAEKLRRQGSLAIEQWGAPEFILGVIAARAAEAAFEKDKTKHYAEAARHLCDARDQGFPLGREPEAWYLLGKTLYLGGRISAARNALRSALPLNPERASELHRLLAAACAADSTPDLKMALAENSRYLANSKLSEAEEQAGTLQRAQILFQSHLYDQCAAALEEIASDSPVAAEAMVLRGRLLYEEAHALRNKRSPSDNDMRVMRQKYRTAIAMLRRAQTRDTVTNQATRPAMYLTGLCLVETGDDRNALSTFMRVSDLFPETPEYLAAALQEAEILRRLDRDAGAMAAYKRALDALTDAENFYNPWVSLSQWRSRMLDAYQESLTAGHFDTCVRLAHMLLPLLTPSRTAELAADAYRQWGEDAIGRGESLPWAKAQTLVHVGREKLRRAGGAYAQLAEVEIASRRYPEFVWNSANAYFQGQDYRNAERMFLKYISSESRQRYPQALMKLVEVRLALGQWDKALEAFHQCIEQHPHDAVVYHGRLRAAEAYVEKGDFRHAQALLEENLNGEYLTPASREWRESLFALGTLLHSAGRYPAAIRRLQEALERYPDASQAMPARYLLADTQYRSALELRAKPRADVSNPVLAARDARVQELLDQARDNFQQVETALTARDQHDLRPTETALLRNSRFALGAVLCDAAQYDDALKAFRAAADRYADQPEVLDAYVQMAGVYRRLGRESEAKSSLEQAKLALAQLKEDARLAETTNHTRQQWSEILTSLSSL